jgi:hypothetical protein
MRPTISNLFSNKLSKVSMQNGYINIPCPKVFSFTDDEQRTESIEFLNWISDLVFNKEQKVQLDFTELKEIMAGPAVALFAEVTRAQLIKGQDIISIIEPTNKEVRALFNDTQLTQALAPGGHRKLIDLFDSNSNFQSGTEPDKYILSSVLNIIEQGIEFKRPEVKLFKRSIEEAMLNVIHHAYESLTEDQYSGIGRRWWQYVQVDKEKQIIYFVIYDMGAGIPSTIKMALGIKKDDDLLVASAMKLGVTRYTNDSGRGNGSETIKKAADIKDESKILVFSEKGMLYINKESSNIASILSETPINGTLIEFKIAY